MKFHHQSRPSVKVQLAGGSGPGFAITVAGISAFALCFGTNVLGNPGRIDGNFIPTPPPDGPVRAILPLSDGSVIVGGEFTSVGSTPQGYLAKYQEDGTFEPTFDPVVNGPVQVITASSSGGFYIGGSFNSVDGTTSGKLALMTSSGNLSTSRMAAGSGFNGTVMAIKENAFGSPTLIIGGSFTTYRGSTAQNLAGLSSSGGLVRNFAVNGTVKTIADCYYNSASFIFGGLFTSTGSYSAKNVGLANSDGALDTSTIFRPNGEITDIISFTSTPTTQMPTAAVVFGGSFTTMSGASPGIAAFRIPSGSTPVKMAFGASGISQASALSMDSDMRLLTGHNTGDLRRFDPITVPASGSWSWGASADFLPSPHTNGKIDALVQERKFRYYIGGEFTTVDSQPIAYFARLLGPQGLSLPIAPTIRKLSIVDDRILLELNAATYATEYDVETSGDGGITWYSAAASNTTFIPILGFRAGQNYLIRSRSKNSNGLGTFGTPTMFTTSAQRTSGPVAFTPLSGTLANGSGTVRDLLVDSGGRLGIITLAGGFYILDSQQKVLFSNNSTNYASVSYAAADPRGGFIVKPNVYPIQRLDGNGKPDAGFTPAYNPDYDLRGIAVQSNGQVILAGTMQEFGGAPNDALVRLTASGSLDAGYDPVFRKGSGPGSVTRLRALAGDRLIVVGDFDSVDEVALNDLAILNSAGELDPTFRPSATTTQSWIFTDAAVDSQGRVLASGLFGNKGDQRTGVIRLLPDGSIDPTWDPPVMIHDRSDVYPDRIVLQPDNKAVVAGTFDTVNGVRGCSVVRLNVNGSIDDTFDSGLGLRNSNGTMCWVNAIVLLPDSTIAVGGWIITVDGEYRGGFALLRGDATATNYDLWLAANNLPVGSGMETDSDGDGFGQGIEFAYGLDPLNLKRKMERSPEAAK